MADIQAQAARRAGQEVLQLKLDEILPNPYQTRSQVDKHYLAELAAWTVVGNTYLNLDEFLMKR